MQTFEFDIFEKYFSHLIKIYTNLLNRLIKSFRWDRNYWYNKLLVNTENKYVVVTNFHSNNVNEDFISIMINLCRMTNKCIQLSKKTIFLNEDVKETLIFTFFINNLNCRIETQNVFYFCTYIFFNVFKFFRVFF